MRAGPVKSIRRNQQGKKSGVEKKLLNKENSFHRISGFKNSQNKSQAEPMNIDPGLSKAKTSLISETISGVQSLSIGSVNSEKTYDKITLYGIVSEKLEKSFSIKNTPEIFNKIFEPFNGQIKSCNFSNPDPDKRRHFVKAYISVRLNKLIIRKIKSIVSEQLTQLDEPKIRKIAHEIRKKYRHDSKDTLHQLIELLTNKFKERVIV